MNLYVGTSGYAYKEWKGLFYPEDLAEKRMLHYYAGVFRSVEINNTFYRMPRESVLEQWRAEVPPEFRFVLKAPQRITHQQRLKDAGDSVAYLFKVAGTLQDRLGPVLFQLPPYLKKDFPLLRDFLQLLPQGCRAAFEFRSRSWFDDDVIGLLKERGAVLCFAETDDGIEVPFLATGPFGYLRLRRSDYGDAELARWAKRVKDQRWSEAFIFFKHEDEARAPQLAKRFRELAGEAG
ncbi:DUF72 domain-containing protein [Geomesophilobacter sediminis]|uniref:DUF72 domain-containing protein n=1 Tax=Geomesophilobacter sediminis TaxID=2798584 RepID=A0A8J7M2I0_9BACT|nr:DUF72 domain-containing protein [Geomesophilobacter sediminis]MBJ6727423.1 DUF72 domain-containing protein [Geomesophilobacter sediminis]